MRTGILTVTAMATFLILSGCATFLSLEPDMEPDWRSEVPVDYMATVYVMEEGERIILGNRNDIYILDGETGAVIDQWRRASGSATGPIWRSPG